MNRRQRRALARQNVALRDDPAVTEHVRQLVAGEKKPNRSERRAMAQSTRRKRL